MADTNSRNDTNSRKSLIPIFILELLQKYTAADHPVTQKWVREQLAEVYGVTIQRQALSQHMNLMASNELDLHIFRSAEGYYYDRDGYRPFRE